MDSRNCIKFCVKNGIKCSKIFDIWLGHLASLPWAECKFDCGITRLRNAEKMSIRTLVTHKSIKVAKKMLMDNHRITIKKVADAVDMLFGSWQTIFSETIRHKHTELWKSNRGVGTIITHQLIHRCLCVSFWPISETVIMPLPPYSTDLAPLIFALFWSAHGYFAI